MALLAVMVTMALYNSLPTSLIISGLYLAWIVDAQTQTVYLTQTVFTACDCALSSSPSLIPSVLPVSARQPFLPGLRTNGIKPLSILTATPAVPALPATETPPVVVSILGGATPGILSTLPLSWPEPMDSIPNNSPGGNVPTSTMLGTFPSLSGLSSALPASVSTLPLSWPEPMDSIPSNPLITTTTTTTTTEIATVASVISLSNGLGPLLSSSTTPTTTYSSGMVSTSPDAGTIIQPITSMMAPTAPSSALTTSGIPPALSVNLSLISSDTSLISSAPLISFGTTSPAVFSTVLPPGLSLATSSQILTTYSVIALHSAYLTGVTVLAPRSPTSCFTLPTPSSSMDMIAVAVTPQDDYDLSNPMLFSFGENATNPQYIGAMASGDSYILNLSPDNPVTGQLGLQIPGQNALVFDGSGLSLFTANCTSLSQVVVDNFYSQLTAMGGLVSLHIPPGNLGKRQGLINTTNFLVDVSVDSYLNTPYFRPNLRFGNSLCTLQTNTMGTAIDNITWSCVYPPPQGGAAACAARLTTWLDGMSMPSTAPQIPTEVLATLSPFLDLAGDTLLSLFPGSDPALSLGFAFMRQVETAAREAVGDVGSAACDVMHGFDSDDLIIEDSGPLGTKTLGSFIHAPPPSMQINLAATATASMAILPARKANPKDDFLKQIATEFVHLLGPFVSWLHHLPPLPSLRPLPGFPPLPGIFGIEETSMVQMPTAELTSSMPTTISTTTTASAQSIVHIEIPTVTVTHVLGQGWFSPSTYVVGPGTSILAQFPGLATDHTPVGSSSASPVDLSTSWTAGLMSTNTVQTVGPQLASINGDPGVRTGWHWDWPNGPNVQSDMTTTTGAAVGNNGHVVLVTTTVTEWMGST